ncbi:hypothetical protein GC173_08350 [bacterium]|nr:hypothetical protein [bacterium]
MRRLAIYLSIFLYVGCGGDKEPEAPAPTPTPTASPTPVPSPTPTPRPTTLDLGDGMSAEVLDWGTDGDGAAKGDTATVALRIVDENEKPVWNGTMELELGSGDGYAGLDRTVTGMTVGQKRRASVPSDFAWKDKELTAGQHTLEVELIRLEKGEQQ